MCFACSPLRLPLQLPSSLLNRILSTPHPLRVNYVEANVYYRPALLPVRLRYL